MAVIIMGIVAPLVVRIWDRIVPPATSPTDLRLKGAQVELTEAQTSDAYISGMDTLLKQIQADNQQLRVEKRLLQEQNASLLKEKAEAQEKVGLLYGEIYDLRKRLGGEGPNNLIRPSGSTDER